jgi:hypothetical protein
LTEELTIPNADLLRTFSNVTTSKETDAPGDGMYFSTKKKKE